MRVGTKRAAWAWMAIGVLGSAQAQESWIFSTSGNGDAPFGRLEDQELGRFDGNTAQLSPWLRTATGAFFQGDADQDGLHEEWNDVDALHVDLGDGGRVRHVIFSLQVDMAGLRDGDIARTTPDGSFELIHSEAQILQDFGLTDGNCDVDALMLGDDGVHWLSFAEDEASTVLDTDGTGEILDGAIVWWDPAGASVGVLYSEADVDTMVDQALGEDVSFGDVTSLALGSGGEVCFSVQSPSSADATVFSDRAGGVVETAEADFGFGNQAELDALAWDAGVSPFPVAHVPQRVVTGTAWSVELHGAPSTLLWVFFAGERGDADAYSRQGFGGLYLDVADPLLWWSLGASWLKGTTDGAGALTLPLPPAAAGWTGTLLGQAFDPAAGSYGSPFAVDFQ